MTRLALFPLILTACPPSDDSKTTESGDPSCTVTSVTTTPNQGATDWYYRGDIEFALDAADASAELTCDAAGHAETSEDGLTLYWVLDEPMTPGTSYGCTLTYCGGTVDLTYTTSPLGTPLSDPDGLVGQTYAVDLTAARIVEPAGIGTLLSTYLTTSILIGVTSVSDTSIELMGAIAVEGGTDQDLCTETIPFDPADFTEAPYFIIGPADTTFVVADLEIDIQGLLIAGTFSADGTYFDGGELSGTIDTRPLVGLMDETDPAAICDIAVNLGVTCETCPSDGQPYCLTLVADQIYAEATGGAPLDERTADEIAADGTCI